MAAVFFIICTMIVTNNKILCQILTMLIHVYFLSILCTDIGLDIYFQTGNPRGFAYIQFAHDEVAKIVADTMNNYLMFGKLIKCKWY